MDSAEHIDPTNDWPQGTQTLGRGLSIVQAIGDGAETLSELAAIIGCTRSTTQRLTAALLQQNWLRLDRAGHYALGPKLARLATRAQSGTPLASLSRTALQSLGERTRDTVHLGIRADDAVMYLDKIESRRGLETRSRVGQRMPLATTGIGRALLLDDDETEWASIYQRTIGTDARFAKWQQRMRDYRRRGCVFDLEDNEIGIRCVAAPLRDGGNTIVGAISVASATPYLGLTRMEALAPLVIATARDISEMLGWREKADATK